MTITITDLHKRFGTFEALRGVDLAIEDGELIALLGPSGSGKTSLLRIIGGLEVADRGQVLFDGADMAGCHARDRRVGFVFQHYALFRHMTVARNIAFGLDVQPRRQRPGRAAIRATVERLLSLVRLDGLGGRYPGELSGGQQQRVALARALAVEPRVLLLDEPFGALDARVRKDLRRWLRRLHGDTGVTTVFVTHDQEEAFEIADRVAIMNQGRIEQVGPPQAVFDRPETPFVYAFLGDAIRLDGRARDGVADLGIVRLPVADGITGAVQAFLRPADFDLADRPGPDRLTGVVAQAFAAGAVVRLELDVPGLPAAVTAEIPRLPDRLICRGQTLSLRPSRSHILSC